MDPAAAQSWADNDRSNGWEAVAARFIAARSEIGASTVRAWARSLPPASPVLDLGCGSGVPIAEALIADGFDVHGVDASGTLTAAFRQRFPHAPVACEPAEESRFFDRQFDGIIAIGLLFLLPPATQDVVIRRAAAALRPAGRLLFTAPAQECRWADALTGRLSLSLGSARYREIVAATGLEPLATAMDEGGNHYFSAVRR